MLSRIAESLFWIGRYIERADGTARILDVYLQLLLEDVAVDEDTACRALLGVMGHDAPPDRKLTRVDVVNTLATDRTQPASIAYSVNAARENARRAREIISTELWEVLNATYANMPRRVNPEQVHVMFGWVRERAALAGGMADSTASRDDAWSFFTLGRFIERADMVARLLATRALTEASGPSWTTILRSVGAYEAYLRTYRGVPSSTNAAEFLLLDRLFPRSILFSVRGAEECLQDIEPRQDRIGYVDQAQRMLGQIRAELEFTPIQEIIENLPTVMDKVQTTTTAVSHAVRERYFPTHNMPAWTREAS
ncbi:alpha-E domain-containing protein [Agrococcus sediminis]|uniref:Alpha-E domain-containing protein n=1 Tax=Agrococcus sediminis TaxID=2599924 RepID=A0A5M8QND4_9MICO|nr:MULTISPECIES: alpha-E domain-containing protein [Agrococcus]KAA6436504.1 alpha-E domain-containing protein [Agrococcus sediminis]RWR24987.1 alpha-E domain-containing protein [Agrococcus lahaulensis]UOW02126.1 alpha-E domain-containing protein [Agrococcus sp. SCSIO52902]